MKTLPVQSKPLLAGDEGKTAAQFREKLLEASMRNLLSRSSRRHGYQLDLEEFHDIRVLDDLLITQA